MMDADTASAALGIELMELDGFVSPARAGDVLVAEAAERTRYGRSGIYDITVRRPDGAVVAEFRGRSRELR
jgi:acyl-CoA thioesterase